MKSSEVRTKRWAILWRSNNHLDGKVRRILAFENAEPKLFHTKKATQEYIKNRYGYIATRKDLRTEPYGWRMPIPIKVDIIIKEK